MRARPQDRAGAYYHGCADERRAAQILREGLKPAAARTATASCIGALPGRVYLTRHLGYALLYAVRDPAHDFTRHVSQFAGLYDLPQPDAGDGFVFEVAGASIRTLQADEDAIPVLLACGRAPLWLIALVRQYGSEQDLLAALAGDYWRGARCARAVWSRLRDDEKFELIDMTGHIAARHAVPLSRAWRFDRACVGQLTKDGGNFFEHAQEVML